MGWVALAYWSELNALFGLIDLAICTDAEAAGMLAPPENANTKPFRQQLGVLWAIRMILIVVAVTWEPLVWIAALVVYLGTASFVGRTIRRWGPSEPSGLVFALSYISIVNWVLGFPYRTNDGVHVLGGIAIVATGVVAAIVAGVASIDEPLIEAWGCYPVNTPLADLNHGMCPQDSRGSWKTCLSLPGTSTCETLEGNTNFVMGPYRVARVVATVSAAVYIAAAPANRRRLTIN